MTGKLKHPVTIYKMNAVTTLHNLGGVSVHIDLFVWQDNQSTKTILHVQQNVNKLLFRDRPQSSYIINIGKVHWFENFSG